MFLAELERSRVKEVLACRLVKYVTWAGYMELLILCPNIYPLEKFSVFFFTQKPPRPTVVQQSLLSFFFLLPHFPRHSKFPEKKKFVLLLWGGEGKYIF